MSDQVAKIAVLIPYYFVPPQNGGHHAAFGFCEALAQEREIVVISTTNNNADPIPFRLEKLFADRFFKYFSPLVAWRLWRFLQKEHIKTCIIQQPFIGLIALPVCRLLGIRFIIYAHNIEFQRFKSTGKWWWRLLYFIEWFIYRAANHLFFISPDDFAEAIPVFRLKPDRCTVIPYGTRLPAAPTDRGEARQMVISRHNIPREVFLILFFGSQSYRPNLEAVEYIVYRINPVLLQKAAFQYRILICGGGLPEAFNRLAEFKSQNVDYLGFVEDIHPYIKAADMVVNPINTGGGVKTKIIEAIALGTTVVSTRTGAKGVDAKACGEKLQIIEDFDYQGFADKILDLQQQSYQPTPALFYQTYAWKNAIRAAIIHLDK